MSIQAATRCLISLSVLTLRARLREATLPAHARLEASLDLLGEPVSSERIIWLLGRFHGFHATWEPALKTVVPESVLRPRLKLSLLQHDLRRLGADEEQLRDLPVCRAATALCQCEAAAAGALYVLEGSTLGGQIISRSLKGNAWYPSEGLRYWNPYETNTGQRWKETLAYLESLPTIWAEEAVDSAIGAFKLLESWLSPQVAEQDALVR